DLPFLNDVFYSLCAQFSVSIIKLMKIDLIAGARPNFMKISPIIDAIKMASQRGEDIAFRLIHTRSEEHTSELQSRENLVCRLLLHRPLSTTLFPYTTLFRSDLPFLNDVFYSLCAQFSVSIIKLMKIDLIAGARPNFMKISPIIDAIKMASQRGEDIAFRLIHT